MAEVERDAATADAAAPLWQAGWVRWIRWGLVGIAVVSFLALLVDTAITDEGGGGRWVSAGLLAWIVIIAAALACFSVMAALVERRRHPPLTIDGRPRREPAADPSIESGRSSP